MFVVQLAEPPFPRRAAILERGLQRFGLLLQAAAAPDKFVEGDVGRGDFRQCLAFALQPVLQFGHSFRIGVTAQQIEAFGQRRLDQLVGVQVALELDVEQALERGLPHAAQQILQLVQAADGRIRVFDEQPIPRGALVMPQNRATAERSLHRQRSAAV